MFDRLNAYRIMWLFVMYDLPVYTKSDRKIHAKFRKYLLADGFQRFQFSMYIRHCISRENAEVHTNRVKLGLPERGTIGIITITDKQFGMMEIFRGQELIKGPETVQQLELF